MNAGLTPRREPRDLSERRPSDIAKSERLDAVVAPVIGDAGQSLHPADRESLESRLGFDFSRVRVHADDRANASAQQLDAAAYAVGNHIAFAAGAYRPSTFEGRALLAHELAHVKFGEPQVIYRSGPLGFFGDIFTAGPGEAFSRLFGEGTFTGEELASYLGKLRDKRQPEGDYDSDNKARAVTKLYVAGDRRFQLDPQLKKLLVREMYQGSVSKGDATAILDILERSLGPDLAAIFAADGVRPKNLYESFDTPERSRLTILLNQRVKGGQSAAFQDRPLEFLGGVSVAPHLNDETFRKRWEEALVKAVDRMRKAMITDPRSCDFPSSVELRFDKQRWNLDPMVEQETPQGRITVRDPSGKGSFRPRSGTPFDAVQSLFDNMDKWECDCLFATQLAQLFAWKDTLPPEAFNAKFAGFRTGAGQGSATTGLEHETVSAVENVTTEDLSRALKSSPVGAVVVWHNTSNYAEGTAFEHEHVIKVLHNGPGQADLYAAQGFEGTKFGDRLTAEQITRHLAEINADFPFRYAVTDQMIRNLQADNVAPSVVDQLKQHLGFEAVTWVKFSKLPPIKELMDLPNIEAHEQLGKVRKWATLPPDEKAAQAYVDKTIVLDRIEIPK